MITYSDPFILLATLIVIVIVLVVGIIIYFAKRNKKNPQQSITSPNASGTILNITAHVKVNSKNIKLDNHSNITLVRDYDNPYAPDLIAVMFNNKKIGYVNAESATVVAPIMDSGVPVFAEVISNTADGNNIRIYTK